jgi:hypothetical protein
MLINRQAMHAANEQAKAAEDQKKAMEMEAMHASQEKAKAEEDQKKAKEMEVRSLIQDIPIHLAIHIHVSTTNMS